jgi:hypothetical protein
MVATEKQGYCRKALLGLRLTALRIFFSLPAKYNLVLL